MPALVLVLLQALPVRTLPDTLRRVSAVDTVRIDMIGDAPSFWTSPLFGVLIGSVLGIIGTLVATQLGARAQRKERLAQQAKADLDGRRARVGAAYAVMREFAHVFHDEAVRLRRSAPRHAVYAKVVAADPRAARVSMEDFDDRRIAVPVSVKIAVVCSAMRRRSVQG